MNAKPDEPAAPMVDAPLDLVALSRRTGLPEAKLLDWERRFGVPAPAGVGPDGRPMFTDAEACRLETIRAKLDAGATEQEAVETSLVPVE